MSKIAFLFPGQGAQTIGMGKQAWQEHDAVKNVFAKAAEILGYSIQDVCFEGPKEKLDSTVISQPALFVTSMAALEVLKATNPEAVEACAGAAGLSLGEYSALAFAGVIGFEDGLRLVQKRGQAMQAAADATPSGMVTVLGLEPEQVSAVCDDARVEGEVLQPANYLGATTIVTSGQRASCERVAEVAEKAGAMKVIPQAVAGAFHTSVMDPATESLSAAVEATEFSDSKVPVYCNVDASAHSAADDFGPLLVKQVCAPVRWHDTITTMLADGYDEFYEVGTGRVLRSLLKRVNRKLPMHGTLD